MRRAIPILVVAAVLLTALVLSQRGSEPLVVSGFVEAHQIRVGSRVGGRVVELHVEEGDVVRAGDVLLALEPFDLLERRAEAEGVLAQRRARLELVEAGYRAEEIRQAEARHAQLAAQLRRLEKGPRDQEVEVGRANVALAEAELELAESDHARVLNLRQDDVVSAGLLDQATSQLKTARAALEARRQELALLEEGSRVEDVERARAQLAEAEAAWELLRSGYRPEELAEARATLAVAQAALQAIERRLAELVVAAPIDGVVESIELRPGDLVARDAPVASLLDTSRLWVRAFVPEGRLALQPDQVVEVSVDPFPGERFRARVGFIAREAEFTPRNVQTPEERSKQVFRIKVYFEQGLDRLRPGMSADVWLEAGE